VRLWFGGCTSQFIEWFPELDRSAVEVDVPYALFHRCFMELALEGQKESEGLIPLSGGRVKAAIIPEAEEGQPVPFTPK
jgi:hypothetical protein